MALSGNLVRTWFKIYLSQRDKPDLIVILLIVSPWRRIIVVKTYPFVTVLLQDFCTMNGFCTVDLSLPSW